MENILLFLFVGSFVAAASSYIGSLMVLKRMSLVGDALSHVALPGMAVAVAFHASPIIGAFAALTIAVTGIWYLEKNSFTYTEALVGIFFTASLAIGVLISDKPELLEALFGSLEQLTLAEGIVSIAVSIILIFLTHTIYNKMIISVVSDELAEASGMNVRRTNLLYLLIVGAVVALGIRFVGTMLTGALVIIPAVCAKNITKGMNQYSLFSVLFGISSAVLGIFIAEAYSLQTGPIVVLVSVFFFAITYILKGTRS